MKELRPVDDYDLETGLTHLWMSFPVQVKINSILACLDRLQVPFIPDLSGTNTCGTDKTSQVGMKAFMYGRGNSREIGNPPKDTIASKAQLAAKDTQIEYLQFKLGKRGDQLKQQEDHSARLTNDALQANTENSTLKQNIELKDARVRELEAELARLQQDPSAGDKRPRTLDAVDVMAMIQTTLAENVLDSRMADLSGQLENERAQATRALAGLRGQLENERAQAAAALADLRGQFENAHAQAQADLRGQLENERAQAAAALADLRTQLENERAQGVHALADLGRQRENADARLQDNNAQTNDYRRLMRTVRNHLQAEIEKRKVDDEKKVTTNNTLRQKLNDMRGLLASGTRVWAEFLKVKPGHTAMLTALQKRLANTIRKVSTQNYLAATVTPAMLPFNQRSLHEFAEQHPPDAGV